MIALCSVSLCKQNLTESCHQYSVQFYINDNFGLKTLDETGRVHIYEIPGVQHLHWHGNKTVFDCCIEPWLT